MQPFLSEYFWDQYFIALVDPNNLISETDENNNVGVAPSSTEMVGPDISVDLIEGPLTLFRGESYVVDIELRNEGGATAENFYCGLYFDNLLITVTDPLPMKLGPLLCARSDNNHSSRSRCFINQWFDQWLIPSGNYRRFANHSFGRTRK